MKRNDIIRKTGICDSGVLCDMLMPESYREIISRVSDLYSEFTEVIKSYPKIVELFEKLESTENELVVEEKEIFYSEGFRLGVLLGLDIANSEK